MPILAVAPHWGAWIEIIPTPSPLVFRRGSHPTGVRGLKYKRDRNVFAAGTVAPHWGAWIEIF